MVCATRPNNKFFFDTTSAQGDLGWSSGQVMGFYKPCRCKFKCKTHESAFIPFVSFGDLDNNTFKGLTSLLSVEQEIQYDEHT
jgi:hypothetical protein